MLKRLKVKYATPSLFDCKETCTSAAVISTKLCPDIQLFILSLKAPKKQTTKFTFAKFQNVFHPSYIALRIQRKKRANSMASDEAAHYELPHLDLHCLQIHMFFYFDANKKHITHAQEKFLATDTRNKMNHPYQYLLHILVNLNVRQQMMYSQWP